MRKHCSIVLLMLVLAIPHLSIAETTCRGGVVYRWKPTGSETPQDVALRSLEAKGADEAAAKAALQQQVAGLTREAQEECRRAHENLAGCMASKYAALAHSLQAASFAARKSMEEAIGADCKKLQGACVEVTAKDEGCTAEAQSSSESAKDEKGKKKK